MEKAELYRLLSNSKKRDPLWDTAFQMYKDEFPNSDLGKECRSCRTKILKWLKRA